MGVIKHFPALQVGAYFDGVQQTSVAEPQISGSPSDQELPDDLFNGLAAVTNAVGTSDFFGIAASTIAKMLNSDRYLVIRYSRYTKPEFLVNTAMSEEAVADYLDDFYRIDPLFRMVRSRVNDQVLTFDQLRKNGTDTLFYDELFRTAAIYDELVILLPTVGGIWTAISVDRSKTLFSEAEVTLARKLFPLMEQLHALHVDRCVFGWNGSYLDDSHIAFMMTDATGNIAFRNSLWSERVSNHLEAEIRAFSTGSPEGLKPINEARIIHWEALDSKNAVAPNGKAYLLEEPSPGYLDLGAEDMIKRFASIYNLTPRETQIIDYTLQGYPTNLIAEHMNVSVGTIRNHKHRLYYKLDITTERELFCMLFHLIKAQKL